jgi:hypothetical protein
MNQTSNVKGAPVGLGVTVGGVSDGVAEGVADGLGVGEGPLPVGADPREPELFETQPAAKSPVIRTRMLRRFISFLLPWGSSPLMVGRGGNTGFTGA